MSCHGSSGPGAASSCARATRCSGRSTIGRTGLAIEYPYFETAEPLVWDEPGTYVETDVEFTQNVTHEWNHGLGEILTALLAGGDGAHGLVEHTSVPYEALPGQMEDVGGGEWRLKDRPERLPHTYTLQAVKRG